MSHSGNTNLNILTSKTPILGQKLYVIVAIAAVCLTAVIVTIFLFLLRKHKQQKQRIKKNSSSLKLETIQIDDDEKIAKTLLSMFELDNDHNDLEEDDDDIKPIIKSVYNSTSNESAGLGSGTGTSSGSVSVDSLSGYGWGRWFSLSEIELATACFAKENVIGEGGYGVVYRGGLLDGSTVAVKNLIDNRGQAEKEFKVEVEAIGKVRHKNLVGLIGFCAEGSKRMLVYEYVDNGNLEQWLHGDVEPANTLTWDIRMKIAVGTAKGLAYLHEGLEPKVVHRDVKSSNILLDKNWNAKVADFGLAKLLESEKSYVTTRVMGTFGYVSPDYASTGMLNEGSDVYSFGVLLMEIITGRSPVDYSRPPGEMNLVDWFRGMVASRRGEELLDPNIDERPSPRALKRALLVCLRCIDMDASKRPRMGQIVHMLEADEFPFRGEPRPPRDTTIPRPVAPAASKVLFPTVGDKQR